MVLPANVLFGLAYARLGPPIAFGAAAALALAGAAVLATVRPARDLTGGSKGATPAAV